MTSDRLADDLAWFMDHLDEPDAGSGQPERMHRRGVWSDPEFGYGSALGAPKLDRRFEEWLYRGERSRVSVDVVMDCPHPFLDADGACPTCAIRDADGAFLGNAGTHHVRREHYRWPMRSAISRVRKRHVRRGFPDLGTTAYHVALSRGDLENARSVLARRFVVMGDDAAALAHFGLALRTVRDWYLVEAPPSPLRATDSESAVAQPAA